LPGSDKYIRSTLFGLSAYHIDGMVIVFDTSKVTTESIKEYIFYEQYASIMKIPFITACINNESIDSLYYTTLSNHIEISNLNYLGFSNIIDFFDKLETINPPKPSDESEITNCVFFVVEINFIPDVGFTFSGTMRSGTLSLKDDVYLTNGTEYYPAKIKSIQRKQIDSQTLFENEGGAIRLEIDNSIASIVTKYMMIVNKKYPTYDSLLFKISDGRENNLLVNDGQKCILFINNNILQVITTNNINKSLINLKLSDNKIILPEIEDYRCFLKTEHTIIIGSLVLL
jgi:GTPase